MFESSKRHFKKLVAYIGILGNLCTYKNIQTFNNNRFNSDVNFMTIDLIQMLI